MSTNSHAHTRCETLRKSSIFTRGMLKFTHKGCFLTIKNSWIEIWMVETCSNASFIRWNFYFWNKTKISIFGGISKFCLWTNFGKFGQFWVEFAALAVADCIPELWLKSLKPHNFWTVSPKTMCNDFLDSFNQFLQVCKVSITSWTYCIQSTLPKSTKSRFGSLCPLGIKTQLLSKNISKI
jgi:hypothetical protein